MEHPKKLTIQHVFRLCLWLLSKQEQEYHQGDSWGSIEVVRVARVRAEEKGELSRKTRPGTDKGTTGTGTDVPGRPNSASQAHSYPTGPAHSRRSLCPSCVYTQAPTQTLRCAGPTTARPQLAANLPSTWNSASSWKAFGHQEQMTLLKAEMIMVFSPNSFPKCSLLP